MPVTVKRLSKQALAADKKAREAANSANIQHYTKTADSFQNFAAALGMDANALFSGGTYGFNPVTRIRTLLEWIHRGSWLGRIAIDLVADDMTRAGVEIKGELDPEQIEEIQETAVGLAVWKCFNEVIKWARLYGGAIGVHLIEGQAFNTPLRIKTVGKDQYRGITVLDRWMVDPSLNDLVTDLGPHLGLPKFYRVRTDAPALRAQSIHHSRCFRMIGIELPYWQRIMEMLWGVSVFEPLYDRMIALDSATQGAAQLVFKSYLRTYKIKQLRELIAAGGKTYQALIKQIQFMSVTQSNEGITLMDSEDEFEAVQANAFSGIDSVLQSLLQQVSGDLGIPLTRMLGQAPAGLNATGDSDIRLYYDGINQQQERDMREPVTTTYRCIAQSLGMKVPDGFSIAFRPLWQLSEVEKAQTAQAVAETIMKYNDAGLISDQVALKEIKQSAQVTGIGSNIRKEDIDAASDVPTPPVDELMPGEGEEGPAPKSKKKKTGDAAADSEQVISPRVGEDSLFDDTGEYDEVAEAHLRDTFSKMFQYADPWSGDPRVFDKAGNYLCGDCNKYEPKACLAVKGEIDPKHGSCRHWENLDAGDPELKFATKISKNMADYGITPNDGFGCKRCEYHTKAKKADSHGRTLFCRQGAFRVFNNGCCALNDTDGMVTF